jgi:RNA polymerase sigma-70 factor (ECF subfamily)
MREGNSQVDIQRLVHDHHGDVYRYANRLCGQAADAEDLVQQTFLAAQRKLQQLRDPEKARSWLLAIARNCFLRTRGKMCPQPASSLDFDLDQVSVPVQDMALDARVLQDAIQELPAEFRVVVLMFYFEFLSYREIADQLEIPTGTVMSRLARAKQHLRRRLMARDGAANGPPPSARAPAPPYLDASLEDSNV